MAWVQRLIIVAGVALAFGLAGTVSGQQPDLPNVDVGVDGDATGSTATQLGTIDTCREVPSGQTFEADIWVRGIPQPVGFSFGLIGFAYNLLYDPAVINITAINNNLMIGAAGTPNPFEVIDANPATDGNDPLPSTGGDLRVDYVDLSEQIESGEGVLTRLTIQAVGPGQTTLQLVSRPDAIDHPLVLPADSGYAYPIAAVQEAVISVDQPCAAPPTARPVEQPLDQDLPAQPTDPPDGSTPDPSGDDDSGNGATDDPDASPAATEEPVETVDAGDAALAVDVIPTGNTRSSVGDIDECAAAEVGDSFTVDVVVEDIDDLLVFEMPILYDSDVLQVDDSETALFLNQGESQVIDTSAQTPDPTGRYVAGAVDAADPLSPDSGSGALVRLTMSAKEEGTTEISLDGFDIDDDGELDRGALLKNDENAIIGDDDGDTFFDGPRTAGEIRVGEDCDDPDARVVTVAEDEDEDDEQVTEEDDDDSSVLPIVLGAGAVIAAIGAGAGYFFMRRRNSTVADDTARQSFL